MDIQKQLGNESIADADASVEAPKLFGMKLLAEIHVHACSITLAYSIFSSAKE